MANAFPLDDATFGRPSSQVVQSNKRVVPGTMAINIIIKIRVARLGV